MSTRVREHLSDIFRAGLAAVDPEAAVQRHLRVEGECLRVGEREIALAGVRRVLLVGAGKASAYMARAVEAALGDRITGGWITVKTGHGCALRRVPVHEAAHPIPDAAGVEGSRRIAELAAGAQRDDLVLCCLSGGGSALMPLPVEGVSLEGKQAVTTALLASGAPIESVNCVRKHLSRLKGGGLARLARPARVATLALSDVIGDRLDVIASGPTAPDATTFREALDALERYGARRQMPRGALEYLEAGARGARPETPKPGDAIFDGVSHTIVASNGAAVAACAARAAALGYRPHVISTAIAGEARDVAARLCAIARDASAHGRPVAAPACLISGGETTVTLRGDGRGGRNQELALAAALALEGAADITLLAAGTDGTDGPTDAAGAFADGDTLRRAAARGLDARAALARNDAYPFFKGLGDLLVTGPTGTNVMDVHLVAIGAP